MHYYALILAVASFLATSSAKPSGFLPAPLIAYTAPVVTSRSSQVVQRNFNAIAAPYVAAPVFAYAPAVPAPAKLVAPAVPAPALVSRYYPAPVVAPAPIAAPYVAAPAPFPYYV